MTSRAVVESFVARQPFALVGMSRTGKKFGNTIHRTLRDKGYRVYPIHPIADTIDGVTCYRTFAALPERVEAAVIVVPPARALEVVRDAAAAGVHHVWLQQGSSSPAVLKACEELGVEAVAGECILMFADPAGFHKFHHWINGVFGKLPA